MSSLKIPIILLTKLVSFVICLFMSCVVVAGENKDVRFYLEHIAVAEKQQEFKGVLSYSRLGYKTESYVYKQVLKDGQIEEWIKLDNTDQGAFFIDGHIECVSEGYKSKLKPNNILRALKKSNIDILLENYDIVLSPQKLIIGDDSARELIFTAKKGYRYTYKLAFDEKTLFPLQFIFLDNDNVLESGQFTEFTPIDDDKGVSNERLNNCLELVEKVKQDNQTDWALGWRPEGFTLIKITKDKHLDDQLVYSDGLVTFSVFIEPLNDIRMSEIQRKLGATAVVSRKVLPIITYPNDKYIITVVGEIPLATAERIALSVQKQL